MKRPELQIWCLYGNQTFPRQEIDFHPRLKILKRPRNMDLIIELIPSQSVEKQRIIKDQGDHVNWGQSHELIWMIIWAGGFLGYNYL